MSKSILVTGGAGFVGSHLCEYLLAQGHTVTCLDNFYTGAIANIEHLFDNPRFALKTQDVAQPVEGSFDQIYNLACPASPPQYQRFPTDTILTSVMGANQMLALARRTGAVLLQASTSEVYGDPLVHPQPESYWGNVNPIGPRACYDEGKRCAEALIVAAVAQYGQPVRIARIFNTYGPQMQPTDGRVVSNFIMQALAGRPLTVYGDGTQTRSFCYVSDLVAGLVALMNHPGPGLVGPVNLGNPGEFTMLELAELVLGMTGSRSELAFEALPLNDPRLRRPDIGLAETLLDWRASVPLAEGLARTIPYFRSLSERRVAS